MLKAVLNMGRYKFYNKGCLQQGGVLVHRLWEAGSNAGFLME